jgi:hypothetical protein
VVKTGFAALVALAALAVVACGGSTSPAGRSHAQPAVLSMAQVEALTRGHPTVLLFTAQGCASCETDARALQDATRGRSDVRLVGVDMTGDDTPQSLQSYVQAMGLESGSFVWMIDSASTLTNRYGITSLSSTVFLDSSGRARFVNQGPLDAGAYAQQLGGLR